MNLIFDIGANRGLFTDKVTSMYNNCKIILVEANPDLIDFLNKKYYNNHNVKILNYAVSSKENQEIDFFINENYDEISTASVDWITNSRFSNNHKWDKVLKVKTITIDRLIEEFGEPDLIKIDVEGYEYDVIQGMTKKQNDICFEWAEEKYEDTNKCCKYLENLGYNDFGYIITDSYMVKPRLFTKWSDSSFHKIINENRKTEWGMMWVK